MAYRGPSLIDGQPVLVVLYGFKGLPTNEKAGACIQAAILRADVFPHQAASTGMDRSICGDCPHRPVNQGTCYYLPTHAINKTWQAAKDLPGNLDGACDAASLSARS